MTDTEQAVDRASAELRTAHREQTGFLDALWDFEAAVRADTKAKCEAAVEKLPWTLAHDFQEVAEAIRGA